jgi:hypothetical protein
LYAGGGFITAGGYASSRLARWARRETIIADFNCDGWVDISDFDTLAQEWQNNGCSVPYGCRGTDLDHSMVVDFPDVLWFTEHWLEQTDW